MLIDFHVHMFPDALAAKALPNLAAICKSPCHADGTVSGTKAMLEGWGVTGAAVMNIATKPRQQTNINNWAAEVQKDPYFFCFGSVHPDAEDAVEEVARIKALGLHGIKLHPDYQNFFVEERRMFPLYEAIAEAGLPVTFHAGRDPLSPSLIHAKSHMLAHVARSFPKLVIIAAHMGGMTTSEEAAQCLAGLDNVYFDTAVASKTCSQKHMKLLIEKHGAERILFASDCPWSRSTDELEFLQTLGLSSGDLDRILYQNALELLR